MLTPHIRPAYLTDPRVVSVTVSAKGLVDAHTGRMLLSFTAPVSQAAALALDVVSITGPIPHAAVPALRALAATGVVLVTHEPVAGVHTLRVVPASPFDMEFASIAARRTQWAPRVGSVPVSALLSSNRLDRLPLVLSALASQTHAHLEVILVLHGIDASQQQLRELIPSSLPVTVVHADASLPFGAALTLGAQAASGHVVTKLDDDDFYGPDHIVDLLVAREHSAAQLVGKALQYVYLEPINVSSRTGSASRTTTSEQFGDWVAGGTLALDRELGDELDWFDPIPRHVDRNIQDKVLAASGRIYRTHGLGYLYVRHDDGHTWVTDFSRYLVGSTEQRRGPWPHAVFGTSSLAVAA